MGISRDVADFSTDDVLDTNRIIRAGLRKFYTAHNWRHLEENLKIVTVVPYATGTVTIVAGVVTLVGGTFPTDTVTNYVFQPAAGGIYEVSVRTDGTHITLFDTTVTAAAGSTFKLYKVNYDMPSLFGGWLDPIHIENETRCLREMVTVPEWQLRGFNGVNLIRTGVPECFSVSQRHATGTSVPTWYLTIFPLPTSVKVLTGRYRIQPFDQLDLASPATAIADPAFSECILAAILSAAEMYVYDVQGVHTQRFTELLAAAIKKDGCMRGTQHILSRDNALFDPLYNLRIAPITYGV